MNFLELVSVGQASDHRIERVCGRYKWLLHVNESDGFDESLCIKEHFGFVKSTDI